MNNNINPKYNELITKLIDIFNNFDRSIYEDIYGGDKVIERGYNKLIINARHLINEYWNENGIESWTSGYYEYLDRIYENLIVLMRMCVRIEIDMMVRRDNDGEEAFEEYKKLMDNTMEIFKYIEKK